MQSFYMSSVFEKSLLSEQSVPEQETATWSLLLFLTLLTIEALDLKLTLVLLSVFNKFLGS